MVRISLYDVEEVLGLPSARYQTIVELFAEPDYPMGDMQIERQYHNQLLEWAVDQALREAKSNYYFHSTSMNIKETINKIVSQYIKYLLSDDLVAEAVVSAIDLLSSPAYTENDVMVDLEVSAYPPDEGLYHLMRDCITTQ